MSDAPPTASLSVPLTPPDTTPADALRELRRVTALFQLRALCVAMGLPPPESTDDGVAS